jgi:hypothetical protein
MTLIPIRIDAFNHDKSTRIVDTLLVDTTAWPIPFVHSKEMTRDLEANVQYFADQVLSDAEVTGLGRSARSFHGREDLWGVGFQQDIADQIREQMYRIVLSNPSKRLRDAERARESKQAKIKTVPMDIVETDSANDKVELPDANQSTIDKKEITAQAATLDDAKDEIPTERRDPIYNSNISFDHLIPIRLRLSAFGVRLHDDFYYDPSLPISPIQMALQICNDLNLTDEFAQLVAVDICEQLCRHCSTSDIPANAEYEAEQGSIVQHGQTTAAWKLDQRVHVANVAHVVQQHKS